MNEKQSKLKEIVICIIAIVMILNTILLVALTFKSGGSYEHKDTLSEQKALNQYRHKVFEKCVKFSEFEINKSDYSERIHGTVKNSSNKDLVNVNIELKCYDSFGDYIGSDSIYISFLAANSTYQVNEYATCDEAESFKVLYTGALYADEIYP